MQLKKYILPLLILSNTSYAFDLEDYAWRYRETRDALLKAQTDFADAKNRYDDFLNLLAANCKQVEDQYDVSKSLSGLMSGKCNRDGEEADPSGGTLSSEKKKLGDILARVVELTPMFVDHRQVTFLGAHRDLFEFLSVLRREIGQKRQEQIDLTPAVVSTKSGCIRKDTSISRSGLTDENLAISYMQKRDELRKAKNELKLATAPAIAAKKAYNAANSVYSRSISCVLPNTTASKIAYDPFLPLNPSEYDRQVLMSKYKPISDPNSGCSGTSKFSYKIASDLWLCAPDNQDGATNFEGIAASCNNSSNFYLATVGPMTRRGLPTQSQWDNAWLKASNNNLRGVVTGQPVNDSSWDRNITPYTQWSGELGGIGFGDTMESSNWQSLVDGNTEDYRSWSTRWTVEKPWDNLVALCMNASGDSKAEVYDSRWRDKYIPPVEGTKIFYSEINPDSGQWQVYGRNITNGNVYKVTRRGDHYYYQSTSSDGLKVAYTNNNWVGYIKDLFTDTVSQIDQEQLNGPIAISGDGTAAAIIKRNNETGHNHMFVKYLTTGLLKQVDVSSDFSVEWYDHHSILGVNSNGSKVVFSTDANLIESDVDGDIDIYVKDMESGTVTILSGSGESSLENGYVINATRLGSANGNYVAYNAQGNITSDFNPELGDTSMVLANISTGQKTILLQRNASDSTSWQDYSILLPNSSGSKIYYNRSFTNEPSYWPERSALYVIDTTTRESTRLLDWNTVGLEDYLYGFNRIELSHDETGVILQYFNRDWEYRVAYFDLVTGQITKPCSTYCSNTW